MLSSLRVREILFCYHKPLANMATYLSMCQRKMSYLVGPSDVATLQLLSLPVCRCVEVSVYPCQLRIYASLSPISPYEQINNQNRDLSLLHSVLARLLPLIATITFVCLVYF